MRFSPPRCAASWTPTSPAQRRVVVVIVLNHVRVDALAVGLGSSGGAIYMMMFDAGVSCAPLLPPTGIWVTTLRGVHERLAGTG